MGKFFSFFITALLTAPFISLVLWIWAIWQLWNQLLTWTIGAVFLLVGMLVWLGLTIVGLIIVIVLLAMSK